jgi:hypothetical protein
VKALARILGGAQGETMERSRRSLLKLGAAATTWTAAWLLAASAKPGDWQVFAQTDPQERPKRILSGFVEAPEVR